MKLPYLEKADLSVLPAVGSETCRSAGKANEWRPQAETGASHNTIEGRKFDKIRELVFYLFVCVWKTIRFRT